MSIFKAFFGLGKIPQVVKFFEFKSFDDVNKISGAIQAMKTEARITGKKFSPAQKKYLDDQMKQVEIVFEQIKPARTKSPLSGIRNTEPAKIFDLQGKEIPKGSKIMGGKEVKTIDELQNYTKSKEDIVQDLVDRKFGKGYFDTVEAVETEAEIAARLQKGNQDSIQKIKMQKKIKKK